jgi:large conductance mechanosensitive channel
MTDDVTSIVGPVTKSKKEILKEKIAARKARLKEKTPSIVKEFFQFLHEYKVVGLAVAFIIGLAANKMIQSMVNNVIMPVITPFIPNGAWQTATFSLWKIVISWGAFLSDLIYFIIVAFAVFIIAKVILREEKVMKK